MLERSSSGLYAVGYGNVAHIDDDIDPVPVAAHIVPDHGEAEAAQSAESPLRKAILVILLIAWAGVMLYQFIPAGSGPSSVYVQALNAQTFQSEVMGGEPEQTWVVNFWSSKRNGGRAFLPVFNGVATDLHDRATFAVVQVDKAPKPAQDFAITEFPTVVIIRHGVAVSRSDGAKDKDELADWLKANLEPEGESTAPASSEAPKAETGGQTQ
jgi:hypothetical protein